MENTSINTSDNTNKNATTNTTDNKNTKKNTKIIIGISAIAVLLITTVAIIITALGQPTKINLNDYVSVSYEGYNSMGQARVTFDKEAFYSDYEEEIEFTKEAESSGYTEIYDLFDVSAAAALMDSVHVSLDINENLSNNTAIHLVWNCDDDLILEMFNCEIIYEETEYIIQGLEDLALFDPFENLQISFEGTAPEGTANLSSIDNSGVFQDMYFVCDTTSGLSNGDTITVTLGGVGDPITYCADNFGCCPTATEKEYTVEGLSEYMTSLDQLSQESIDAFVTQATDVFNARVALDWREESVVDEVSCAGFYLLTPKEGVTLYGDEKNGYLYLLLRVNATIGFRKGFFNSASEFVPMELYYSVGFPVPIIDGDGNCIINTTDYRQCMNAIILELEGYNDEYLFAYETIDEFFYDKIQTELADYNYETNVE